MAYPPQTKVYYAHCLGLYNTPQERRDIDTLLFFDFIVVNPNCAEVQEKCDWIKANSVQPDPGAEVMEYFKKFALECDAIAFRALPDGSIPAGVAKEIAMFKAEDKPVIELPTAVLKRTLSVESTREYLGEVGYR
jgi:hypothetical protein